MIKRIVIFMAVFAVLVTVVSSASAAVTVAVVDTGLAAPYLTDAIPGPDLVDGGVVTRDGGDSRDNLLHGTSVTQIVRIFAPDAAIMPIRILDTTGYTTQDRIADALVYAVDHGANVVNLSLGGIYMPDSKLANAFSYAEAHHVLAVCSAGNDAITDKIATPANLPGCIAVSAVDTDGWLADYSNDSPAVAISGYGVAQAFSTTGQTVWSEGTSFAAPRVSAALAVVLAAGITPDMAVRAVLATAIPTGSHGAGEVDPTEALLWATTTKCERNLVVRPTGNTNGFARCSPKMLRFLTHVRKTKQGGRIWANASGILHYTAPKHAWTRDQIGRLVIVSSTRAARVQRAAWPTVPHIQPNIFDPTPQTPAPATPVTPVVDPDPATTSPDNCDPVNEVCATRSLY